MKTLLRLALAAGLVGIASPALAQGTATTTFQVTAHVRESCTIVSVPDLAFGDYDAVTGSLVAAATTLTFRCNPNTAYEIALDKGANPDATAFGTRAMVLGGESLGYGLYTDLAHTDLWGAAAGVDTVTGTAPAPPADVALPIYGNIPAGQWVTSGDYTDTAVTVTITY